MSIETSNIMAHFCDNTQEGYIDIFSCKKFDYGIAVDTVQQYFKPEHISQSILVRQA